MNSIAYYFGFFIFLIICSIIAYCIAKKHNPWVWYIVGATIQLFSLLGGEAEKYYREDTYSTLPDWIIYFVLLIFFAVIISKRRNSGKSNKQEDTLS